MLTLQPSNGLFPPQLNSAMPLSGGGKSRRCRRQSKKSRKTRGKKTRRRNGKK